MRADEDGAHCSAWIHWYRDMKAVLLTRFCGGEKFDLLLFFVPPLHFNKTDQSYIMFINSAVDQLHVGDLMSVICNGGPDVHVKGVMVALMCKICHG